MRLSVGGRAALPSHPICQLVDLASNKPDPEGELKDAVSHFVLRLAYCRTEEVRALPRHPPRASQKMRGGFITTFHLSRVHEATPDGDTVGDAAVGATVV